MTVSVCFNETLITAKSLSMTHVGGGCSLSKIRETRMGFFMD